VLDVIGLVRLPMWRCASTRLTLSARAMSDCIGCKPLLKSI